MGVGIGFYQQDHPFTIKVESHGISWNLVESRGISSNLVTIEVVFLSESVSYYNEVSESDDEVEFLQMIK